MILIKSTYFIGVDIHPATDGAKLGFQFNVAGGADFNETLIGSYWRSYHDEGDSGTGVGYVTSEESDGTGYTILDGGVGNDNDQCASGTVTCVGSIKHISCDSLYGRNNSL